MKGPDQYDIDDALMDELGGAMDDMDAKKFMPVVQVTVAVSKDGQTKPEEEALPTPEEMAELESLG
jgi:hypothetical protein